MNGYKYTSGLNQMYVQHTFPFPINLFKIHVNFLFWIIIELKKIVGIAEYFLKKKKLFLEREKI